jgi:signal transduction histidine kinase/CheY-like chemotaxis protein
MKTLVQLRETKELKEIQIGFNKPEVDSNMKNKWQSMLNTICDISNIPAALIMNVTEDQMNCLVSNDNFDNPYRPGDSCHLESGLYCETVIGTNSYLQINNALLNDKWKDNPDVELSMISYAGMPLVWPDNEIFGTICGLDSVEIKDSKTLSKLLKEFKILVEKDLANLLFFEEYGVIKKSNKELSEKLNQIITNKIDTDDSLLKSSFLKRISHSLITPTTTIKGLADFGINESKDKNLTEYFTKISRSSDYLLILFNDILDFQQISENSLSLNYMNSNLKDITEKSFRLIADVCKEKKIDFEIESDLKDTLIFADPERLTQIFVNLLSNSTTYTYEGGKISVKVTSRPKDENYITSEFIISDTGIGMSKEFQKKMFKPFAKENNTDLLNNGAGLGLPIVKSLVELMQGTIECQSEINKGTTFKIKLNLHKTLNRDSHNKTNLVNICKYNDINILLAEDNKINSKIIARILEKGNMSVKVVDNGLKAYNEIKANGDTYDLILMDINMPEMNGNEATKKIREHGFDKVIIALSANSNKDDISKALQSGVDAFLSKPIDTSKLLTIISFFTHLGC